MRAFSFQHQKTGRLIQESRQAVPDSVLAAIPSFLRGDYTEEQQQVVFDCIATTSEEKRWLKVQCCDFGHTGLFTSLFPVCPQVSNRRPHFRRDVDDKHELECPIAPGNDGAAAPKRIYKRLECTPLDLSQFLRGHLQLDVLPTSPQDRSATSAEYPVLVQPVHQTTLRTLMAGVSFLAGHHLILNPNDVSDRLTIQWPERRIFDAARHIVDKNGSGMSLEDLLVIPRHFPASEEHLKQLVANRAEENWQGSGDPVCFAWLTALDVQRSGKSFLFGAEGARRNAIALNHWIRVPVRGDLEAVGPYAVLLKYMWSRPSGWQVVCSYAHPLLRSTVWMLVDAVGERNTALALYWIREELKKRGICVEIIKPLFDCFVDDFPIRPDFQIRFVMPDGSQRLLFIETMGSTAKIYLDGKRAPHARMRKKGELFEDWRLRTMTGDDHKTATRKLHDLVFGWISAQVGRPIR
jgi:hypothetical protein